MAVGRRKGLEFGKANDEAPGPGKADTFPLPRRLLALVLALGAWEGTASNGEEKGEALLPAFEFKF